MSYASPGVTPHQKLCLPRAMPQQENCLTRSYASPGVMPHQELCLSRSYVAPGVTLHQKLCFPTSDARPGVMSHQELCLRQPPPASILVSLRSDGQFCSKNVFRGCPVSISEFVLRTFFRPSPKLHIMCFLDKCARPVCSKNFFRDTKK